MMPETAWRVASILGFLCLVGAYLVNQRGRCRSDSSRYLIANVVGSGLLTAYSVTIGEWVFVALEGFWCAASLWALQSRPTPTPPAPPTRPAEAPRGSSAG